MVPTLEYYLIVSNGLFSVLVCGFSLLSRGLWKFVWSISHVSPATVCVPLRPNDPAITTTILYSGGDCNLATGIYLCTLQSRSIPTLLLSNFYMLCTILFALRVFLVARASSVSAFCILGWLTLHPQRERETNGQRTGGKNAMQCFYNCNAVVESSQVLSKFLYCLQHTHSGRETCSITFLISTTTIQLPVNSIDSVGSGSEQKETHCRTKDDFKEMTTRYQNIITRAQPILNNPETPESGKLINLFEHH